MITFVLLIFEFAVFQVLIHAIKGISLIFSSQNRGNHNEYGPRAALCLGTPLDITITLMFHNVLVLWQRQFSLFDLPETAKST